MTTHQRLALAFTLTTSLSTLACAGDLDDEHGNDGSDAPAQGMVGPHVHSELRDEGGQRTRVDATDEAGWVYFDLDTGTELDVADPARDLDWDLAFQRFNVATNGGISGAAGVEVAIVETSFDGVIKEPADGYVVDEPDGDDENEDPDYAFDEWYGYDVMTHTLMPNARTYVVLSGRGNAYKIAFENYYDDAGTSGHPTFIWAAL